MFYVLHKVLDLIFSGYYFLNWDFNDFLLVFCHYAFFFVKSLSPSSELFHHFRQKIVVKSLLLYHLNSPKLTIHLHETRILQFANSNIIILRFTLLMKSLFCGKICNFIKRLRVNSGSNFCSFHSSLHYIHHMKISDSNKKKCKIFR